MHEQRGDYLGAIDANLWPAVANPPSARFLSRYAESHFAAACEKAGLTLTPATKADLIVDHEQLFDRLATAGWTGLAESYLAGEWRTPDSATLVHVLASLIAADYHMRSTPMRSPEGVSNGELPPELVRLFAGDGMSSSGGVFATGVPTTIREAGVDITDLSEPVDVEREDLGDGQRRAVELLLDDAGVGPGTHLLDIPSSGGAVAANAALRRATVDTVTTDVRQREAEKERLTLAGVADSVHTVVREDVTQWRARYDAIVSVEKLENMPIGERDQVLQAIDRMLSIGGRAAVQVVVATETMSHAGREAERILEQYIWPGQRYLTVEQWNELLLKETGLRIVSRRHFGSHYELSLKLQRSLFESHTREAAAEGFDTVYRRLWIYQFAVREALFHNRQLDAVQLTLAHRNRGGRR